MIAKTEYFAPTALLPEGWANNVKITVNQDGWIDDVQANSKPGSAILLEGSLLPGMLDLHSHAFQRAMAGLAERVTTNKDSFWTWRETMYRFLERIIPEDLQAIAAQLYIELLKGGYTTVGEFHYLHHQSNGTAYEDRSLMAKQIATAAKETGIALTLMPVLYAYSNFGQKPPTEGQKRFINHEAQILEIFSVLLKDYQTDPQITIGFAHHSLRAISPEMLRNVTAEIKRLAPITPLHMHIAEQMKEVNDCVAATGVRPVEWLLANAEINAKWCLVHATHMTTSETENLAKTGAVVSLCPTTEGNLGDGIFNLPEYFAAGGQIGIGTDSNISVSVIEELRLLEYSQRLLRQERIVARDAKENSVGSLLYKKTLSGGAQALGRATGAIAKGKRADFMVLDSTLPTLLFKEKDLLLDSMIFAGGPNPIKHVIVGGQQVIQDYHHKKEEQVYKKYKQVLQKLIQA